MGEGIGLSAIKISDRLLWIGGTTELLLCKIDPNEIRLIGRWHSDKFLIFLYVTTCPLMQGCSVTIVSAGNYILIPAAPLVSTVG